jgi:alpha-L-fucosidase
MYEKLKTDTDFLQVHFNMATSGGSIAMGGSCSKNASTFNPTQLDTDQWVESFTAFGVREAVLVAKHSCGFVTWPSNATMPDGSRYNYSVASSSWREGKGDVVAAFKASCLQAGLGVGYYYSLGDNSYAKRLHLTSEQLEAIELQQMRELWSGEYGNGGNLTEIWFDGGIEPDSRPAITAMLKQLQPGAVAFNGCVVPHGGAQSKGSCVTPNAVRWIGSEAGTAPSPNWASGFTNGGDPHAGMFCPSESDTTLQNGDQWFFDPTSGIRTLGELQDVYHDTVGHNSFLMMDFAPTPEGIIAPDQVARCELQLQSHTHTHTHTRAHTHTALIRVLVFTIQIGFHTYNLCSQTRSSATGCGVATLARVWLPASSSTHRRVTQALLVR